jgi:hypothetical protein
MTEHPLQIVVDGVTYETDGPPVVAQRGDGPIEVTYRVLPPAEHDPIHFSTPTTAVERGEVGTTLASHRWTREEAARVEEAIRTVAARWKGIYRGVSEQRPHSEPTGCFTTADVWAELGEGFPVTKGIAAKMTAAARAGVIENTGRHAYNDHPDRAHAHGQRLTVWRAR